MKRTSPLPHVGQRTPSGQRKLTIVRSATFGSAKYRIASVSVFGWGAWVFMRPNMAPAVYWSVFYYI